MREDYTARGQTWTAFTYEDARYRVYRWGEDGILGWTDDACQLCLAPALWNGRDEHLKERLFGLTGPEGNHGEDVKELYFYLDATPTHSFTRGLYKDPHAAYPYARFREEARRRGRAGREFDVEDAGLFDAGAYFDLEVEYAKAGPEDVVVVYRVENHGPAARLHLLAQLWLRNTWSWGRERASRPGGASGRPGTAPSSSSTPRSGPVGSRWSRAPHPRGSSPRTRPTARPSGALPTTPPTYATPSTAASSRATRPR